jgi:hypothetical protein
MPGDGRSMDWNPSDTSVVDRKRNAHHGVWQATRGERMGVKVLGRFERFESMQWKE